MNKIRLVVNNVPKRNEKEKFFIKKELQSILNLYAKMVSNGSWKDYSFTSGTCLLYTSPSPRDRTRSRMPSSA